MSNPNYCAVLFILDSSGSMGETYKPMQEAFHKMLEQQARKLAGYITVDVSYFEGHASYGESMADPLMVNLSMYANGGTEIYNNVNTLISQFQGYIGALPEDEQPGHHVVIILTDGEAATPRNRTLADKIQALKKSGEWSFGYVCSADYVGDSGYRSTLGHLGLTKDDGIRESFEGEGINEIARRVGELITKGRAGAANFVS